MTRMRVQGYSLASICDFVGISRQAYHKRLKTRREKADLYQRVEQIVIDNRKSKSRAGLRSIYHKEKLYSLLGVNQFEQHLSVCGYALKPYRSYIKTTDSRGHHYKFDNLIEGSTVNGENQVIVGDITYYRGENELYYIFQFQDYYTLEIKGLVGSKTMEGVYAEKCLRQVFLYNQKRKYNNRLTLHTDGGGQYRSNAFQNMLRKAQIRPSHAKNCLENGLSERANGIVKNEYLIDYQIKSIDQLNQVLKKIKHQHNSVYPSKTLGYKTPKEYAYLTRQMSANERPLKKIKKVE